MSISNSIASVINSMAEELANNMKSIPTKNQVTPLPSPPPQIEEPLPPVNVEKSEQEDLINAVKEMSSEIPIDDAPFSFEDENVPDGIKDMISQKALEFEKIFNLGSLTQEETLPPTKVEEPLVVSFQKKEDNPLVEEIKSESKKIIQDSNRLNNQINDIKKIMEMGNKRKNGKRVETRIVTGTKKLVKMADLDKLQSEDEFSSNALAKINQFKNDENIIKVDLDQTKISGENIKSCSYEISKSANGENKVIVNKKCTFESNPAVVLLECYIKALWKDYKELAATFEMPMAEEEKMNFKIAFHFDKKYFESCGVAFQMGFDLIVTGLLSGVGDVTFNASSKLEIVSIESILELVKKWISENYGNEVLNQLSAVDIKRALLKYLMPFHYGKYATLNDEEFSKVHQLTLDGGNVKEYMNTINFDSPGRIGIKGTLRNCDLISRFRECEVTCATTIMRSLVSPKPLTLQERFQTIREAIYTNMLKYKVYIDGKDISYNDLK